MENDVVLRVRVPSEMKTQLERLADENHVSVSSLVRSNLWGAIYGAHNQEAVADVVSVIRDPKFRKLLEAFNDGAV